MSKVSVIIATYNLGKYIKEALDSVLRQSFTDYEIIVVDDGSTDNTREILNMYQNQIKYIYQRNKGVAAARNTGIKAASGDYIALLDADDLWFPHYLESQVGILEKNSDIGLVYGNAYLMENNKILNKMVWNIDNQPLDDAPDLFLQLLEKNFIFVMTLVPKSIYFKLGLFDERLSGVDDYDMWLRILKAGYRIKSNKEPLAIYRLREDSQFKLYNERIAERLVEVYRKAIRDYNLTPLEKKISKRSIKRTIHYWFKVNLSKANSDLLERKYREAKFNYLKAWRVKHFNFRVNIALLLISIYPNLLRYLLLLKRRIWKITP